MGTSAATGVIDERGLVTWGVELPASGRRAVTLEFVPNDDRVTPPGAASFSFVMLSSTRAGDAYTFAEYRRMFEAAGFSRLSLHELPPTDQRVITARR